MSIKTLNLKKNDLQPYYSAQAKDASGAVIPLTGASIVCTMKQMGVSTPKIDRQSTGINITDAGNAEFEYQWQSGDTDTVGTFQIEFEITPASGGKFTLPADEKARVVIGESLDAV